LVQYRRLELDGRRRREERKSEFSRLNSFDRIKLTRSGEVGFLSVDELAGVHVAVEREVIWKLKSVLQQQERKIEGRKERT